MHKSAPLFRSAQENPVITGCLEHFMETTAKTPYVTSEAAALVRRHPETLLKSAKKHGHFKGVKPIRLGGKLLWPRDQIDALLTGEVA